CQLPGTPTGAPDPPAPVELRVFGTGLAGATGVASERTRRSGTPIVGIPRLAVARVVCMRPRIATSTRTLARRWRRPVVATRESFPILTLTTLRTAEPVTIAIRTSYTPLRPMCSWRTIVGGREPASAGLAAHDRAAPTARRGSTAWIARIRVT